MQGIEVLQVKIRMFPNINLQVRRLLDPNARGPMTGQAYSWNHPSDVFRQAQACFMGTCWEKATSQQRVNNHNMRKVSFINRLWQMPPHFIIGPQRVLVSQEVESKVRADLLASEIVTKFRRMHKRRNHHFYRFYRSCEPAWRRSEALSTENVLRETFPDGKRLLGELWDASHHVSKPQPNLRNHHHKLIRRKSNNFKQSKFIVIQLHERWLNQGCGYKCWFSNRFFQVHIKRRRWHMQRDFKTNFIAQRDLWFWCIGDHWGPCRANTDWWTIQFHLTWQHGLSRQRKCHKNSTISTQSAFSQQEWTNRRTLGTSNGAEISWKGRVYLHLHVLNNIRSNIWVKHCSFGKNAMLQSGEAFQRGCYLSHFENLLDLS